MIYFIKKFLNIAILSLMLRSSSIQYNFDSISNNRNQIEIFDKIYINSMLIKKE